MWFHLARLLLGADERCASEHFLYFVGELCIFSIYTTVTMAKDKG